MPHGIRPTPNILRKAIFDILGQDLTGMVILELFAGSGAIGLEALSLGAKMVTFVEREPLCSRVIEENLKLLNIPSYENGQIRYQVIPSDVFAAIKQMARLGKKFDCIILDPPYGEELGKKVLKLLTSYDILHPVCYLIIQFDKWETLPKAEGPFRLIKERKYGTSFLAVYERKPS